MDHFVKINEVQRIVKDCVMDGEMYEKVCRFENTALKNKEKLDRMDTVV